MPKYDQTREEHIESRNNAVDQAEAELRILLQNPDFSAKQLLAFHAKWTATATNMHLGRMYNKLVRQGVLK